MIVNLHEIIPAEPRWFKLTLPDQSVSYQAARAVRIQALKVAELVGDVQWLRLWPGDLHFRNRGWYGEDFSPQSAFRRPAALPIRSPLRRSFQQRYCV